MLQNYIEPSRHQAQRSNAVLQLGDNKTQLTVYGALKYQYNSNTCSLNISLVPFDKPVQLQLYNDIGQLVNFAELPSQTTTYQFDLNSLSNGIYFLTLVSDKHITKQKIWKY